MLKMYLLAFLMLDPLPNSLLAFPLLDLLLKLSPNTY